MTIASYAGEAGDFAEAIAPERDSGEASVGQAAHAMHKLYRANLEVRLQCIDDTTLSEHQRQIRQKVAEAQIPKTQPFAFSADEGADVGLDAETNVSPDYKQNANAFTGRIVRVTVEQK